MWKSSESQSENFPLTHFSSRITEARAQPHNNKLSNKRRERKQKFLLLSWRTKIFHHFLLLLDILIFLFFGIYLTTSNTQHRNIPTATALCYLLWARCEMKEKSITKMVRMKMLILFLLLFYIWMDVWKHYSHHVYLSLMYTIIRERERFF